MFYRIVYYVMAENNVFRLENLHITMKTRTIICFMCVTDGAVYVYQTAINNKNTIYTHHIANRSVCCALIHI